MSKQLLALIALLVLPACTTFDQWLVSTQPVPDNNRTTNQFNFRWKLSGDKSVAPLQVFDNGAQTWLQFQYGQNLPAIFGIDSSGEHPLIYTRTGEYVVIEGLWHKLSFRGGALSAYATRVTDDNEEERKSHLIELMPVETFALKEDTTPVESRIFEASISDQTLRHVLQRWASDAGWVFNPEHWSVDADIPVSAYASFSGSFEDAVEELISSTELADKPLQPCFYSNQVLRVVPYAQTCDRAYSGVTL